MMYKDIFAQFPQRKVMVLGDLMLDHYIWGNVERISQEAPVPILEAAREEYRLGGAANVALNLRSLGAQVCLVGMYGGDAAAEEMREILANAGIPSDSLLTVPTRRSTLKTRVMARNQQMVRIDYEDSSIVNSAIEEQLIEIIQRQLPGCDALIIEDYDKGLMTPALIASAIDSAQKAGIPVTVDPKYRHFFHYREVDLFKPNFSELQNSIGKILPDEESFLTAASELRKELAVNYLVVTRGALGMSIFSDGEVRHLPTVAREVFDVSGAGDTVISVLTLAWISGASIDQAAKIANHAAGVVCGKRGTAVVSIAEILESLNEQG